MPALALICIVIALMAIIVFQPPPQAPQPDGLETLVKTVRAMRVAPVPWARLAHRLPIPRRVPRTADHLLRWLAQGDARQPDGAWWLAADAFMQSQDERYDVRDNVRRWLEAAAVSHDVCGPSAAPARWRAMLAATPGLLAWARPS